MRWSSGWPGRLMARSDDRPRPRRTATAHRAVARAREFLVAEAHRAVASEELERVTGLDRFTLARQFRATTERRRIATRSVGDWRAHRR